MIGHRLSGRVLRYKEPAKEPSSSQGFSCGTRGCHVLGVWPFGGWMSRLEADRILPIQVGAKLWDWLSFGQM